jgi:hypothetical protein
MPSDTIRRDRGGLEQLVLEVCNRIKNGAIVSDADKPWTPHRLAQEVLATFPGAGANPSTGAISDTLKRWEACGFAVVNHGPLAFVEFTPEAETVGLQGLKDRARAARPPRAPRSKALAPSGTVTLEVNPGDDAAAQEADEELVAGQTRALDEVLADIPTPGDALVQAEEITAEGGVEVVHSPDGGNVVVHDIDLDEQTRRVHTQHHDDAEYAQGDPHPTAQDDGWVPRDEWDELSSNGTRPEDEPEQGQAAEGGVVREVRSIDLDDEVTDQPNRDDDPFG